VAATSVATRVAEEVGTVLGDEVGYAIRFEDLSSPTRTRIKYMTDGMLFRETMVDPLLSKYSVIMVRPTINFVQTSMLDGSWLQIDEAHERGAYTDLLLGLLKKVMKKRPELRIIISSATIDAEDFMEYFNTNAGGEDRSKDDAVSKSPHSLISSCGKFWQVVVSLEGRMFPVEVCYLKEPVSDYCEAAVETVFNIHMKEPNGDILVFLTGREEIDNVLQQVADRAQRYVPHRFWNMLTCSLPGAAPKILPLPLYASLPPEEQALIFDSAPRDTRKIIFATNIAEASVTIDGIKYVVDCGFVKVSCAFQSVQLMIDQNLQSAHSHGRPLRHSLFISISKSTSRSSRPYIRRQMFPPLPLKPPSYPKHVFANANNDPTRTHSIRCIHVPTPTQSFRDR
jgi:ATP-dependent RNA helicase DDX35